MFKTTQPYSIPYLSRPNTLNPHFRVAHTCTHAHMHAWPEASALSAVSDAYAIDKNFTRIPRPRQRNRCAV